MRISEAARAAGVGVETIRFYERKGLIVRPLRPAAGGFGSYPAETVARIRFIRQAQDIGFSLREIQELLSLQLDPGADCGDVRAHAQAKLDEVNRKITSLKRIKDALDVLIEGCPGEGALGKCSILAALTTSIDGQSDSQRPA